MNKPGIVNIRGKEYTTVAMRVRTFRDKHPSWTIRTTILDRNADMVLMEAAVLDDAGRLIGNGHAEEWRKSSEINKTSMIENAETSAIGRALANLGLGGTEFASANEIDIARAKAQVEPPDEGAEKALADMKAQLDEATTRAELRKILEMQRSVCSQKQDTKTYTILRTYATERAATMPKDQEAA